MSAQPDHAKADVALRVPADGAFVYVLRATAASLAARLDFTVDDVEDLRIAIGEAASLLLELAPADGDLDCVFCLAPYSITAKLSVPSSSALAVVGDSFAWQVLDTVTASCSSDHEGDRAVIHLEVQSALAPVDDSVVGELD